MTSITKSTYKSVRKAYSNPIQIMHALYNMHCDKNKRIGSMAQFEGLFNMWLGNKGYKLLQGCLIILKKFDQTFA